MEVIRERAYAREQLRHQSMCVQKTEEQVAIGNRKLEAVVMENLRYVHLIVDIFKYSHFLLFSL